MATEPSLTPSDRSPTPDNTWRMQGLPDPFGDSYDCERDDLTLGDFTDDELANAVFLHGDDRPNMDAIIAGAAKMPIVYLTAAKERIRWLSRKLHAALAAPVAQPQAEVMREAAREAIDAMIAADEHFCGTGIRSERLVKAIASLRAALTASALPTALKWDVDGRDAKMDGTILMGKGYDWLGWDALRREAKGRADLYAVWPDKPYWSLYCVNSGALYQELPSEEAAKAKAEEIECAALASPPQKEAPADTRTCTCHPDDNPPQPCPRKFALNECQSAVDAREPASPVVPPARTPQDYAIEHAEYMAQAVDHYIDAENAHQELLMKLEDGEGPDPELIDQARQDVVEYRSTMTNRVYEFRKRRDRSMLAASPVVTEPVEAEREPTPEPPCSTHPDAPHGFNRNGSHNAGRYVCDCEGWKPEEAEREPVTVPRLSAEELAALPGSIWPRSEAVQAAILAKASALSTDTFVLGDAE